MSNEHFTHQSLDNNPVSMQKLANVIILLAMSPVLLVLVVVSVTYVISALLTVSGVLG
jgi:hypothetical protein